MSQSKAHLPVNRRRFLRAASTATPGLFAVGRGMGAVGDSESPDDDVLKEEGCSTIARTWWRSFSSDRS